MSRENPGVGGSIPSVPTMFSGSWTSENSFRVECVSRLVLKSGTPSLECRRLGDLYTSKNSQDAPMGPSIPVSRRRSIDDSRCTIAVERRSIPAAGSRSGSSMPNRIQTSRRRGGARSRCRRCLARGNGCSGRSEGGERVGLGAHWS
jgi:hypothetical protein